MGDDLEELARKGRDRTAKRRDDAARDSRRTRTRADKTARALAIESLDQWARVRRLVAGAVVLGGLVVGAQLWTGKPSVAEFFAIVGGALGALFLALLLADSAARPIAARELRRLGALPFRFPVEPYRAALGRQRHVCSPRLTVTFAAPVAAADRALIADAAEGAVKRTRARWSGDALVVESEPIDTVFRIGGTRGSSSKNVYSNHRVHLWVRAVIQRALLPAHRRAQIEELSVEIV